MYVFAVKPLIVVLAVEPVIAPGFMVQFPAGKPFSTTLPVGSTHVGWVMVPTDGAPGLAFTVTEVEADAVQEPASVTVTL